MAEDSMRPVSFAEYFGQEALKAELMIRIKSARISGRPLENMLLVAPPGSGKTSLAQIIGIELGEPTELLTMPVSLRILINAVRCNDGILVLDELHCASNALQNAMLPLVERHVLLDSGGRQIHVPDLTIVGATTEPQDIIKPLYERFLVRPEWVDYNDEDMSQIVESMGRKAGVDLPPDVSLAFAQASLGAPRRGRQFVLAYRDLVTAFGGQPPSVEEALALCNTEFEAYEDGQARATIGDVVREAAGMR